MHSRRAQQALARLPEVDPAIAALALWCSYRDTQGSTVTEGEVIRIGPDFPLLPLPEQVGLIAHHVLHVALCHSARRSTAAERYGQGFQPQLFDLACDAMVNEALLQGGHALPRPAVRAVQIAALLPKDERPENILADWDSDRLYAAMHQASNGASGADEGQFERYAKAQGFSPDLKGGAADRTEAQIWAGRITQALGAGQRAGSGIGAILARFGDLPKATTPWEIRLRRLLNKALWAQPRRTFRAPARAWLAREALARQAGGPVPVFEPGVARQQPRPRLVIGVDTSSSITGRVLELFMAEALSIQRRSGAEAHLLGFDTELHSRTRLDSAASLGRIAMRTGGGTDFAPVLAAAAALDPSMIIVLTDLDAPLPAETYSGVLWAVPTPPKAMPRFGEILVMQDLP